MTRDFAAALFANEGESVYAVLDGASCAGLLGKLAEFNPPQVCLYAGELAADVRACAPYLVRLEFRSDFTAWLVDEGWGQHWGIFAASSAGIKDLRKHFRTFLTVKGPDGGRLYFRFYDPRVLRSFLPIALPIQLAAMFGPVDRYVAEGADDEVLQYGYASAELTTRSLPVKVR